MRARHWVVAATLVAACTETPPTDPGDPAFANGPSPNAALPAQVNALVHGLYAPGNRSQANKAVADLKKASGDAASPAFVAFVKMLLDDLAAGRLSDPNGAAPPSTGEAVGVLVGLAAELAGLPSPFDGNPLAYDGALAIIGSQGGSVATSDGRAGLVMPPGALNEAVLVVIEKLPDAQTRGAGPLSTTRSQYGPFYEISTFPHVTLAQPAAVEICPRPVGDPFGPESPAIAVRLALAHPDPTDPGSVEVLSPTPGFLACNGVAGLTTSFSPFAALGPGPITLLDGQLAVGANFACAIRADSLTDCWGDISSGHLGNNLPVTSLGVSAPVDVASDPVFVRIDGGGLHTCGTTSTGAILCWGSNRNFGHALANGTVLPSVVASPTPLAAGPYVSYSAGRLHACGLTPTNAAECWGVNQVGEVGDGTADLAGSAMRLSPVPVNTALTFASIDAGWLQTCALTAAGDPYCWGRWRGQGNPTASLTPELVPGGHSFTSIFAGAVATCALDTQSDAWCWGDNLGQQLGGGSAQPWEETPVQVLGGLKFATLATSLGVTNQRSGHTCGLTFAGAAFCWGLNSDGQLGDGTNANRPTPVAVATLEIFVDIAAGERFTCGLTPDRRVFCWGSNASGELGSGVAGGFSPTPVQVF